MRFSEVEQLTEPVGFAGLTLQLGNLHLQRGIFLAQILIFDRRALQRKIVIPSAPHVAHAVYARALERRKRPHRPNANQPPLGVALDLQGQQ